MLASDYDKLTALEQHFKLNSCIAAMGQITQKTVSQTLQLAELLFARASLLAKQHRNIAAITEYKKATALLQPNDNIPLDHLFMRILCHNAIAKIMLTSNVPRGSGYSAIYFLGSALAELNRIDTKANNILLQKIYSQQYLGMAIGNTNLEAAIAKFRNAIHLGFKIQSYTANKTLYHSYQCISKQYSLTKAVALEYNNHCLYSKIYHLLSNFFTTGFGDLLAKITIINYKILPRIVIIDIIDAMLQAIWYAKQATLRNTHIVRALKDATYRQQYLQTLGLLVKHSYEII